MTDPIEFDPVDRIAAGALGQPGSRRFFIQAERGGAAVTVLVEKEQVAVLSARLLQLLAEIDEYYPDEDDDLAGAEVAGVHDDEPLFRARMMRIGFEPTRGLVVLELFEGALDDEEAAVEADEIDTEDLGLVARLYATRAQMRAVAASGAEAVSGGRPTCRLCQLPMDPAGHDCPSRN